MSSKRLVLIFLLYRTIYSYKPRVIDNVIEANRKQGKSSIDDVILPQQTSTSSHHDFSAAIKFKRSLWPNAIIPYKLDKSIVRRFNYVKVIKQAMSEWERVTCIRFVNKANETSIREYVKISYGAQGCRASVGRWRGGASILSLGKWCDNLAVVLHELGHTIGFFHEQNRLDRNKYVKILWKNIAPRNRRYFFRKLRLAASRGFPYDYSSIMHYGTKTFSRNGKPTIISLDPSIKSLGNTGLSQLDVRQTNVLYNCIDYPKFPEDFFVTTGKPPQTANCVTIKEPMDPSWNDTNICYKKDKKIAILWSHSGMIPSMECTNTIMPNKASHARYWKDNYLCVPSNGKLKFHWLTSDQSKGTSCLVMKSGDGNRARYYLCEKKQSVPTKGSDGYSPWSPWQPCSKDCGGGGQFRYRTCERRKRCIGMPFDIRMCNVQKCLEWPRFPEDFKFYIGHSQPGLSCVPIYERSQYMSWINNKFCWSIVNRRNLRIAWSDRGEVPGMNCTKITEPTQRHSNDWDDNYLCHQRNAPYNFRWSSNGTIKGLKCIPWKQRMAGWNNSYLCGDEFPVKNSCPLDWTAYTTKQFDFCYLQIRQKRSWKHANIDCLKRNAQMLSLASSKEAKFVETKVQSTHSWIGLNYNQTQWKWVDGANVTYTNWRGVQHHNRKPGEDCALVDIYTSKWRKWSCNARFSFICKMKIPRNTSN